MCAHDHDMDNGLPLVLTATGPRSAGNARATRLRFRDRPETDLGEAQPEATEAESGLQAWPIEPWNSGQFAEINEERGPSRPICKKPVARLAAGRLPVADSGRCRVGRDRALPCPGLSKYATDRWRPRERRG